MTTILARSGPAFTKIGWTLEDLGSRNKKKTAQWTITPVALDGHRETWPCQRPVESSQIVIGGSLHCLSKR